MRSLRPGLVLVAAVALAGCASEPPLYSWGPYEAQVYAHFKNSSSPDEQILVLEQHAQETRAQGQRLPPGFRVHLGLLYAKVGRDGEFVAALEEEKAAFPESAAYIDPLLKRMRPGRSTGHEKK